MVRGPSAATPAEAIGWGRSLADSVLFFVGHRPGKPYNAGTALLTDPETGQHWPSVPDPLDLARRAARATDHVRYGPLGHDRP